MFNCNQVKKIIWTTCILQVLAVCDGLAQMPQGQDDFGPPSGRYGDDLGPPPFRQGPGFGGRPPFGPGPMRRNGSSNLQVKPSAYQPDEHILSALSPSQKLSTFNNNVKVFLNRDLLEVESNGIPNHPTGNYPNEYNPNSILEQDYHFKIPLKPKLAEHPTSLPFGPIGVGVNGIPFYNPYNAQGRDAVFGPNAEVFDYCCGHPDPMGRYHYHKYPVCINSPFRDPQGKHSPLIGWAFDGFAIYGPNGERGQPPNDLDECNGHTDSARGYHYHVTNKFPYILGAYRGVVEMSNFDRHGW